MGDCAMKLREYLDADWARLLEFGGQPIVRRRWRNNFSPRFAPVYFLRIAQRLHQKNATRLAKVFSFANFLIFGLEVPARLEIGSGLVLPHTHGTILGAGRIGRNVTIYQQVTLGARFADFDYIVDQRPDIADGALITAGAKIIGGVRIGKNARIGANAVVTKDVPDDHIAVGVPAQSRPIGGQGRPE